MNAAILANRSSADRNKTDFYPTPPDVTTALLDFLESERVIDRRALVWEPACGEGDMAELLRARGYGVVCSDLHRTGYHHGGVDFLQNECHDADWIITNPPFSLAEKFIRHAIELQRPCAFLVKSQFWHAKSRLQLFRESGPRYVLPLTWRPDFMRGAKGGKPTMECCWSVWEGVPAVRTEYIPLERPKEIGGKA